MPGFIVRVKTKSGQVMVENLTPTSTFNELQNHLSLVCNIPLPTLSLLTGYPPKPLQNISPQTTLAELGLKSGDTLIAQESELLKTPNAFAHHYAMQDYAEGGPLMRRVVPADNSCLFTSVGFVLGGKIDTTCGKMMRQIIVEQVSKDEENYSEAILGKPRKEYCDWISKSESWGGAIELAVLSHFYGIEIAVIDTINAVINRFGEDKNYACRVFLIFDGIHYDPIYRETLRPDGSIQTIFPTTNDKVLGEAAELAMEAKSSKQYTDVNSFQLRCLVCQEMLRGQVQAQAHAQSTGHMNFGEYFQDLVEEEKEIKQKKATGGLLIGQ